MENSFCIIIVLVLSYPAFSYDIFNYMFTAKTVLLYHKNPYEVIPMQFISIDPWVNVMRWIHLPSAYTPIWILLSLPAYFFGFGTFLLILWNFKIIAAFFLSPCNKRNLYGSQKKLILIMRCLVWQCLRSIR